VSSVLSSAAGDGREELLSPGLDACSDLIAWRHRSRPVPGSDTAMKRLVIGFAFVTSIALLLGTGVVWNEYLRAPPVEHQPLPSNLIPLDSTMGQALLDESDAVADYDELLANFVAQSRKGYCGVATAITTLNAAGVTGTPLDQQTLFANPSVDANPWKVSFIGMSLRDLGDLLSAHGAKVSVINASSTNADAFRQVVRTNLNRNGDYVLINYERKHIGQAQSGHISPLAAYHAQSDRVLILDVAAHKYPPVWVRLDEVWDAMNAPLNPETSVTRGFIIVHGRAGDQGDMPVSALVSLGPH
jgi:hypothetical protein